MERTLKLVNMVKILGALSLLIFILGYSYIFGMAKAPKQGFYSGKIFYRTLNSKNVEVCGIKDSADKAGALKIPGNVKYHGKTYRVTQIADMERNIEDWTCTKKYKGGDYLADSCRNTYDGYYMIKDETEIPDLNFRELCATDHLTKVILPDTIEYIGDGSLGGYSHFKKIVFAKKYKKLVIGNDVFNSYCKKIVLPEGTVEIGDFAFDNYVDQTVVLPSTLKKIGKSAFSKGERSKVKLSKNNPYFTMEKGVIYTKNMKTLVCATAAVPSVVKIPNSVTKMEINAFAMRKVKKVILNNKIREIPEAAFCDCVNLEEVSGMENVKCIRYGAFYLCEKLKSIGKCENLRSIERAAFWHDNNLTLYIGRKVAEIDNYALSGTKNETCMQINIPDGNDILEIENGMLIKTSGSERVAIAPVSD